MYGGPRSKSDGILGVLQQTVSSSLAAAPAAALAISVALITSGLTHIVCLTVLWCPRGRAGVAGMRGVVRVVHSARGHGDRMAVGPEHHGHGSRRSIRDPVLMHYGP